MEDLSEHPSGPMRALDRHLSQWEWSSVAGRLEIEWKALITASFQNAQGYVNDPILYADSERNLLNRARTCYITRPMMMVAMQAAGIEFTKSDTNLMLTHRHLDPRYVAQDWAKPLDMHLDGTRCPTLTTEMLPFREGLLLMEPGMFYADYDLPTVENFGGDGLGYVEIMAVGWTCVDDVSSSHGPAPGVVLYVYTRPHPIVSEVQVHRHGSAPPMQMIDFSGWAMGEPWEIGGWELPKVLDTAVLRPHVASARMFMAAVWGLMGAYLDSQKPERPQWKKAKRLKMPEDGDVSVIHLRKFLQLAKRKTTAQDYDEDGDPTWSHRWIVSPHWAWRACKCHAEGRHRVYIEAYIKGPEHLPLVIKEKILSIDR